MRHHVEGIRSNHGRGWCLVLLAPFLWLVPHQTVIAATPDLALAADPFAPTSFILAPGRTAGWQFTVNLPIHITALGLFDAFDDGFQSQYPVGVWNSAGTLLTSAIVPAGTLAPSDEGFRYVAASNPGVTYSPGEVYTIGYFAAGIFPNDTMISNNVGDYSVSPVINQLPGGVVTAGGQSGLSMPTSPFFDTWVGPSFQFTTVPTPGAWIFAGAALLTNRRRRRD